MKNNIQVGTRLEVFWSDDEAYYAGKVTEKRCIQDSDAKQKPIKKRKKDIQKSSERYTYLVEYDDGDEEWIDASTSTIRIIDEKSDEIRQQKSRDRAARLKIDSKLLIWWPAEKAYFSGTLDKIHDINKNPKPHRIQYDDGDSEWTNLCQRTWMLKSEDQLKSNTKVEVWWPVEKESYPGTITKIDESKILPHHIQYDDGGSEWTDLFHRRFEIVEIPKEPSSTSTISRVQPSSDDELIANTRVKVWCPIKKKNNLGTLTKTDGKWDLPHRIEYDDGSSEWTYLNYRKFEIVKEANEPSSAAILVQKPSNVQLKVNTRVMVWWPLEKKSYPGTLTKIDTKRELPHHIQYDDGERMWTNLDKDSFEIIDKSKEKPSTISQVQPETSNQVAVNTKVMVWWPLRKKSIAGTLTKIDTESRFPHYIEYVNGESEWTDLNHRRFEIVREVKEQSSTASQAQAPSDEQLVANTQVQVWFPLEKKNFVGVLIKIDLERDLPHQIKYEDRESEWTNLNNREFDIIGKVGKVPSTISQVQSPSNDKLRLNMRLMVWFPLEKKSSWGILTQIDKKRDLPHYIEYVNGDAEWTDLNDRKYEIVGETKETPSTCTTSELQIIESDDQLKVNSRVMVWWPLDKKSYPGTLTKIDTKSDLPHYIEYDDGECMWTKLNEGNFELVEAGIDALPAISQVEPVASDQPIENVRKVKKSSKAAIELKVNSRVMVWWPLDKKSYPGTLTKIDSKRDLPHYIQYDDGDSEWTDLNNRRFEIVGGAKKMSNLAEKLKTNSRVMVWWPLDKTEFSGEVIEIDLKRDLPHHIRYDDGDTEWTDLNNRKFEIVGEAKKSSNLAEKLKVDTAVSVWWPLEEKEFSGTITKIDAKRDLPHHIQYDDGDVEWTNLNNRNFKILQKMKDLLPKRYQKTKNEPATKNRKKVLVRNLKRRKKIITNAPLSQPSNETEEIKHYSENGRTVSNSKRRRISSPIEDSIASKETHTHDNSTTLKCKQCDETRRGLRALSCHHILCKTCRKALKVRECPICQEAINKHLRRYDADHDSFKAIEALDVITTRVTFEFFCASNASVGRKILKPSQIVKACNSYKRDEQEYEGYLWRFKGDKKKISKPNSKSSKGIPIEQVSLESGEIIEAFNSLQKAVEKTGVSRKTIRRVLDGKGEANGGGFFWRLKGNTNRPSAYTAPTTKDPVANIPCVQISKVKNGVVFQQFRTPRDAQEYINSSKNYKNHYSWSQICQWCREEDYKLGFYWKYERLGEDMNPADSIIGTRIRVFQDDNEWVQGYLDSYDSETGRHKIKYDCGKCEEHRLEDIKYDLDSDQGRDVALPVEQVDVKTGKILASFDSALEAAFAAGEESESHILAVCEGQKRSCHGYFWRFKGSTNKQTKLEVQQLCFETGEVIATFETIPAASKAVGVSSQGISNCCDGSNRSKSAGGFGWRFAIDDEEVVMVD